MQIKWLPGGSCPVCYPLSVCHWFCGCKRVYAVSIYLHMCADVGVYACRHVSSLEWWVTLGFPVCLQILPAACEVIPSMVLVFQLITLPGHSNHVSSVLAWGAFPVCGPSLCHIQGRCVKATSKIAVGLQGVCKQCFRSINQCLPENDYHILFSDRTPQVKKKEKEKVVQYVQQNVHGHFAHHNST